MRNWHIFSAVCCLLSLSLQASAAPPPGPDSGLELNSLTVIEATSPSTGLSNIRIDPVTALTGASFGSPIILPTDTVNIGLGGTQVPTWLVDRQVPDMHQQTAGSTQVPTWLVDRQGTAAIVERFQAERTDNNALIAPTNDTKLSFKPDLRTVSIESGRAMLRTEADPLVVETPAGAVEIAPGTTVYVSLAEPGNLLVEVLDGTDPKVIIRTEGRSIDLGVGEVGRLSPSSPQSHSYVTALVNSPAQLHAPATLPEIEGAGSNQPGSGGPGSGHPDSGQQGGSFPGANGPDSGRPGVDRKGEQQPRVDPIAIRDDAIQASSAEAPLVETLKDIQLTPWEPEPPRISSPGSGGNVGNDPPPLRPPDDILTAHGRLARDRSGSGKQIVGNTGALRFTTTNRLSSVEESYKQRLRSFLNSLAVKRRSYPKYSEGHPHYPLAHRLPPANDASYFVAREGSVINKTPIGHIKIEKGAVFVAPATTWTIETPKASVRIPAGTMVNLDVSEDKIIVRVCAGAPGTIHVGHKRIKAQPGTELVISPAHHPSPDLSFDGIARRRTSAYQAGEQEVIWICDFHVTSYMLNSEFVRYLRRDTSRQAANLVGQLMKASAALSHATRTHGPYHIR